MVVLAGDINRGAHGVAWASGTFPEVPVPVAGSHELCAERIGRRHAKLRQAAPGSNEHILENDTLELDGYPSLAPRFGRISNWSATGRLQGLQPQRRKKA